MGAGESDFMDGRMYMCIGAGRSEAVEAGIYIRILSGSMMEW